MGCGFFITRIFKRRRIGSDRTSQTPIIKYYGPRPAHDSIASGTSTISDLEKLDFEKTFLRDRDQSTISSPLPPTSIADLQPTVHPQFSAYAGIAVPDDLYTLRYRGGSNRSDWTGSQASTKASSQQSDQYLAKLKDEGGVDDPEEAARRKKAEEIRRKVEQEEQERLDFFQLM